MKPKVVHICNGYSTSLLYHELMSRLAGEFDQTVISPTFEMPQWAPNGYRVEFFMRGRSILERMFYGRKLRRTQRFIESVVNMPDVNLIHAHTLFTDGIPAYRLSQQYDIPYIVAVRNSDINVFIKYFVYYRSLVYKVLKNASAIVLISPIYRKRLQAILPNSIFPEIQSKIVVLPNGVNKNWLQTRISKPLIIRDEFTVVFCGYFVENKNIVRLTQAVEKLMSKYPYLRLKLIGHNKNKADKDQSNKIVHLVQQFASNSKGRIQILEKQSQNELREIYSKCHLFAMPSHTETFGLVYVEALSQGLPVIYTQNEGFDGFFKNNTIGVAVDAKSVSSISNGIELIIREYSRFSTNVVSSNLKQFDWDSIANKYNQFYKEFLRRL